MSTLAAPASGRAAVSSSQLGTNVPDGPVTASVGGLQLSGLGKRIEMLRVDRGVSKQVLARAAGTSRQQLWRVMTGKSELTSTLCQRLASVLDVDSRTLSSASFAAARGTATTIAGAPSTATAALFPEPSLAGYLASAAYVYQTMRTLPTGDDGVALKCALLNTLEERARSAHLALPAWVFRVRAKVLDGSL